MRPRFSLIRDFALLATVLVFQTAAISELKFDTMSSLSVLIDIYTYQPESMKIKNAARTSIVEPLEVQRPDSPYWFVRPFKNPAGEFTKMELRTLTDWLQREKVAGLVLDGHQEVGDAQVARLRSLNKLTLLSLRKTG